MKGDKPLNISKEKLKVCLICLYYGSWNTELIHNSYIWTFIFYKLIYEAYMVCCSYKHYF